MNSISLPSSFTIATSSYAYNNSNGSNGRQLDFSSQCASFIKSLALAPTRHAWPQSHRREDVARCGEDGRSKIAAVRYVTTGFLHIYLNVTRCFFRSVEGLLFVKLASDV
jgi:hypothetical protein